DDGGKRNRRPSRRHGDGQLGREHFRVKGGKGDVESRTQQGDDQGKQAEKAEEGGDYIALVIILRAVIKLGEDRRGDQRVGSTVDEDDHLPFQQVADGRIGAFRILDQGKGSPVVILYH